MDLKQHKTLLREYEKAIADLSALKNAKPDTEWIAAANINVGDGNFYAEIPLPADCAATLLREHIWALEAKANDLAQAIGVEFDL